MKTRHLNRSHFVFSNNMFIGFGLRVKYVNKKTFEEIRDPSYYGHYLYNPPKHESYWASGLPSFQAGIKFGWERKKVRSEDDAP